MNSNDVYEVRTGETDPVAVWREFDPPPGKTGPTWVQVGYVSAYEYHMARQGHTPEVVLKRQWVDPLCERHYWFCKAVGRLVRTPDRDAVVKLVDEVGGRR